MFKKSTEREDWEFSEKYNFYLPTFSEILSIPKEYRKQYYELAPCVEAYIELRYEHFEDLLMYSLMFRNVVVCYLPEDFLFFAEKKKEIVGYRSKVAANPENLRHKVVELYFKYGLFFEAYCEKKFGIKMFQRTLPPGGVEFSYESYLKAKEGNYDSTFCVNDLTEQQCQLILQDANELITAYGFCSIPAPIPKCETKFEFVKEIACPLYNSNTLKERCLRTFLRRNTNYNEGLILSSELEKQINEIRSIDIYDDKEGRIAKLRAEISTIDSHPLELVRNLIPKEKVSQIEELNKQITEIKNELRNRRDGLIKKLTDELFSNSVSWNYLYIHQHELQNFITHVYTVIYNRQINHPVKGQYEWEESLRYTTTASKACSEKLVEAYFYKCEIDRPPLSTHVKDRIKRSVESSVRVDIPRWVDCVQNYLEPGRKERRIERKKQEEKERKEREEKAEAARYNLRNSHPQDIKIKFIPSTHTYEVDGVCLDSVTTFVTNCFPKFNAELYAKRKADRLGINYKEILDEWEKKGQESRDLGTAMHKKIEDYYLGKEPSDDETFKLFLMFANRIKLKPYRTEWAIYDWEYKIAGTIDFVDYQNEEYIIYDWKRSDKLISGNGLPIKKNQYDEKALPPIDHLDDSPYYHYALQLSLYKFILERNYNIKVSKLRLGIFHPTYHKPYILEIPYLEDEINTLFELKSEVIF